jgi:RNA polymerase sigma-70 factor (ECF subfamily)
VARLCVAPHYSGVRSHALPFLAAVFGDDSPPSRAGIRRNERGRAAEMPSATAEDTAERTLIDRLRARDSAAYASLVDEIGSALLNFAMLFVKSDDVAHDVVQDVFVRIHILGEAFQPSQTLRGYLFGAVRNRALHIIRHDRMVRRHMERWRVETETATSSDTGRIDDRVLALERELAALTPHQRAAIALRYDASLSVAEVAEALGIGTEGAAKLLTRTMQRLRERLRETR